MQKNKILFHGRHLLHTTFQEQALGRLAQRLKAESGEVEVVFAVTSANHANSRFNPVPFHYRSENADLYAERPLIQLSCRGEVTAVHYNSRSIAPLLDRSPARASPFYAAYRRFAALLRDARFQLKFRLAGGEIVVFDNQRILHGRTPFSSARHARHLRGCYLTRDSVYSAAALLRRAQPQAGS